MEDSNRYSDVRRDLIHEFNTALDLDHNTVPHIVDDIIMSHIHSSDSNCVGEFECPVCLEPHNIFDRVTITCNHHMCEECMKQYLETQHITYNSPCCPLCRQTMVVLEMPNEDIFERLSNHIQLLSNKNKCFKTRLETLIDVCELFILNDTIEINDYVHYITLNDFENILY